jgi:dUTP pyrophosphatase
MTERLTDLRGVLPAALIRRLLAADPPLATGLADADLQVQPNGLDVRLESVWASQGTGGLGRNERALPRRRELPFGSDDWLHLPAGHYVVRLCETVNLPPDVMALGLSRSSLLRSGCALLNAVWDAGYRGRSEALLVVFHPDGFRVQRGARIGQLVFFPPAHSTEPYAGAYQGENLVEPPA